jgi:hypothetical protein
VISNLLGTTPERRSICLDEKSLRGTPQPASAF